MPGGSKRVLVIGGYGLIGAAITLSLVIGAYPRIQAVFDRYEPVAFLAYLSHFLLVKVIWIGMSLAGATLMGAGYLVYFFIAPALVFLVARAVYPLIDVLPAPLPVLIKGKAGLGRVVKKPVPA